MLYINYSSIKLGAGNTQTANMPKKKKKGTSITNQPKVTVYSIYFKSNLFAFQILFKCAAPEKL